MLGIAIKTSFILFIVTNCAKMASHIHKAIITAPIVCSTQTPASNTHLATSFQILHCIDGDDGYVCVRMRVFAIHFRFGTHTVHLE